MAGAFRAASVPRNAGEKRPWTALGIPMQMRDYGPRDGETIVGRGATTHLIQDDQRASGALGKDKSSLGCGDHDRSSQPGLDSMCLDVAHATEPDVRGGAIRGIGIARVGAVAIAIAGVAKIAAAAHDAPRAAGGAGGIDGR